MLNKLLKAGAFLLIYALIHLAITSYYHSIQPIPLEIQTGEYMKRVWIIGDSHAGCAVDYDILDDAALIHSRYSLHTHLILKNLFDQNISKPTLVILPIDLHSFSPYLIDVFMYEEYWGKRRDNIEFQLAILTSNIRLFKSLMNSYFPFRGAGVELLTALAESGINGSEKGYERPYVCGETEFSELNETERLKISKRKADVMFANQDTFDGVLVSYFKKNLELFKENNITVVLIKFPITEELYLHSTRYILDEEDFYGDIINMTEGYNNIYILDYQQVFFNETHLFRDPDHLNSEGAKLFSEMLKTDLQRIEY